MSRCEILREGILFTRELAERIGENEWMEKNWGRQVGIESWGLVLFY